MKAVMLRNGRIEFEDVAMPEAGPGQVLVKSNSCGICGSDLHFYKHPNELLGPDPVPDVFLGHEYSAEIVAFGPECEEKFLVGDRVCSIPFLQGASVADRQAIGTGPAIYGAYSEYFLLSEALLLKVADNLPDAAVALVEPLAVGMHAVSRSDIKLGSIAWVCGAGPIGLATIASLKKLGIDTIIASDPTGKRRDLALQMGASAVFDPTAVDVMAEINGLIAESETLNSETPIVIFECVGIHTMIPELIEVAPPRSTIVFAGVHTKETSFNPIIGMVKELDIKFTFYYENSEYEAALNYLASGDLTWQPLVTGTVGYDGIQGAFEALLAPNDHIKIMIEPWRKGQLVSS